MKGALWMDFQHIEKIVADDINKLNCHVPFLVYVRLKKDIKKSAVIFSDEDDDDQKSLAIFKGGRAFGWPDKKITQIFSANIMRLKGGREKSPSDVIVIRSFDPRTQKETGAIYRFHTISNGTIHRIDHLRRVYGPTVIPLRLHFFWKGMFDSYRPLKEGWDDAQISEKTHTINKVPSLLDYICEE
jgi:hypothetical protein